MLKGLDHVVLVVLDLDAAVADHRTRGFTVTPGGVHAGGMTHNALVGFQDGSYLELIAFLDLAAARGKHSWAPIAERGGGWADLAVLSNDLFQDATALGDLVAKPPEDGGRTRSDGLAIAWRVARLVPPRRSQRTHGRGFRLDTRHADRVPQQLERALHVGLAADTHQDPVVART